MMERKRQFTEQEGLIEVISDRLLVFAKGSAKWEAKRQSGVLKEGS